MHEDVIEVLVGWIRSQHQRLSAALAGGPCPSRPVREFNMPADLQPLIDEITQADTVIDSAVVFIAGIPALIAAAVAAAIAGGATAVQLKPVTDLGDTLKAKAQALSDAMTTNTPQAKKK